jgi:hypothetical protein
MVDHLAGTEHVLAGLLPAATSDEMRGRNA